MWNNKYIIASLALFVFLALLLYSVTTNALYHKTEIEVYKIFEDAVHIDIDIRGKEGRIKTNTVKGEKYYTDSTTIQKNGVIINQKRNSESRGKNEYSIKQRFLSTRVPMKVQVVDSLFSAALQRAGIQAQTVVKCSVVNGLNNTDNTVTYSRDISLWTYYSLPVYEMEDTNHKFTMNLQGFIKYPFGYVLKNAIYVPCFWLLILTCIGSLFWLFKWSKKQKSSSKSSGMPLNEPIQIQPATREWLAVVDNILFDGKSGEIMYNKEIVLQLKGLNLKLFSLFVKEKDICITYDRLKTEVWENQELDNKTVSLQINRLSKELSDKIEILSIENIRGVGYRLIVNKQSELEKA